MKLALKVRQARPEQPAQQASQAQPEQPVLKVKQDLLALRAQTLLFPVLKAPKVLQAQLVSACKVPRANKVSKVCRVKWVLRACKVPKVQTLLFQAPLAQPEQPVPKVCKALKAPKVFKVSQAQPDQPVLKVCKE